MNPVLEPINGLVVALFNLGPDVIQVVWSGPRTLQPRDGGCARGGSLEESSSGHGLLIAVKSARYNSNVGASKQRLKRQQILFALGSITKQSPVS